MTWHSGSSFRVLPLCVGMKREEATQSETAPNEIPSWELCKYFHPLPQPVDRLIPLTLLINQRGVERGSDGRSWISGHMAVVGNCPHQHPVCNCPWLWFTSKHRQVKIAFWIQQYWWQLMANGMQKFLPRAEMIRILTTFVMTKWSQYFCSAQTARLSSCKKTTP